MSYQMAAPQTVIQIFPYDGSSFSFPTSFSKLPNGGLLECTVHKSIRSSSPGTCTLVLVPGGPNGPNQGPSWSQIIVPLSLILVTMIRGNNGTVTFAGIIKTVSESTDWSQVPPARRTVVQCVDFQHFLTAYNFYTLTFLGTLGAPGAPDLPTGSFLGATNPGLVTGNPVSVGLNWLTTVIFVVLQYLGFKTATATQSSTVIKFVQLIAPVFQQFSLPNSPPPSPTIPIGYGTLATTESSWWSKFQEIFNPPFYELFLQTVPIRFFNDILSRFNDTGTSLNPGNYPFAINQQIPYLLNMSYDNTPVIALVARQFPFPVPDLSTGTVPTNNWDTLPVFFPGQETGWTLGGQASPYTTSVFQNASQYQTQTQMSSLLESSITFDADRVKNFFAIQPTFANNILGEANGAFYAGYLNALGVDLNSIARYGYQPYIAETQWFSTNTPQTAQANSSQFSGSQYSGGILPLFFEYMLEIMAAETEPTPYMGRGIATDLLRPDILAGNRYIYAPFKETPSELWMFYITGTTHRFIFGGRSTTTLDLDRGLPVSLYEGTGASGKTPLYQLLTGQLVRKDGQYVQTTTSAGIATTTGQKTLDINTLSTIRTRFQHYIPFLFTGAFTDSPGKGS